jgi:hypothetical protein
MKRWKEQAETLDAIVQAMYRLEAQASELRHKAIEVASTIDHPKIAELVGMSKRGHYQSAYIYSHMVATLFHLMKGETTGGRG